MRLLKLAQTAEPLPFLMVDSTDHLTGKTGLAPTVTLSKNGGAFAAPAGAVSEIGNGWYKVAGNATDAGTLGPLILHAESAGADPVDIQWQVVAFDPQDVDGLGLTTLDAAVSGANTVAPDNAGIAAAEAAAAAAQSAAETAESAAVANFIEILKIPRVGTTKRYRRVARDPDAHSVDFAVEEVT